MALIDIKEASIFTDEEQQRNLKLVQIHKTTDTTGCPAPSYLSILIPLFELVEHFRRGAGKTARIRGLGCLL